MSAASSIPAPIATFVSEYAALLRRRRVGRAVGVALAFTAGWVLVCCALDRAFALPATLRLVLLVINALIALVLLARPVVSWALGRTDWLSATDAIEQCDPRLGQRLQTVASQHLSDHRYRGSDAMIERLTDEVTTLLATSAPHGLVPLGPVVRPWALAGALWLIIGLLSLVPLLGMPRLLVRYAMPWIDLAPVTTTRLIVSPGDVNVLEGDRLTIRVSAERVGAGSVTLHYQKAGAAARTIMPRGEDGAYIAEIGPLDRDVPYYVSGGDATTRTYVARVLRRPIVREFQVRYVYPASTRRDPLTVSNADGLIEAPVGTRATMTIVASEPLVAGEFRLEGAPIGLEPTADRRVWRAALSVERDATYALHMVSQADVEGTFDRGVIRAIPDSPPLVHLVRPTVDLRLHPRDITALPYDALDDYGLGAMAARVEVLATSRQRAPANLAEGKPSRQSSTWAGAEASRAVDGETSGASAVASATQPGASNWWEVDLGAVHALGSVEIWNTDKAERLADFDVIVSEHPMDGASAEALEARPDVARLHVSGVGGRPTTLDVDRDARFVRIVLPRNGSLALAEVRAFERLPVLSRDQLPPPPPTTRPTEAPLPITSDPRRQSGEVRLDLAALNVQVGDVVLVSVRATDTAGQTTTSETARILVLPRSIDLATHERIGELRAAERHATALVEELEQATRALPHADPQNQQNRTQYLEGVSRVSRHLSGASESAGRLLPSLLRASARSRSPEFATTIAHYADRAQAAATAAERGHANIGYGRTPDPKDVEDVRQALDAGRQMRDELRTISQGERAAAVLADRDNLKAAQAEPTPSDPAAAERVQQRNQRLKDDIAGAARELGLNPDAADLDQQLQRKVEAAEQLMRGKPMLDFEPEARRFADAVREHPDGQHALPDRLHAVAQAEAVRPDADLVRARDLALASEAARQIELAARQQEHQQRQQASSREQPQEQSHSPQSPQEAAAQLPEAMAALRREHELNRRAPSEVSPEERQTVQQHAAEARRKLNQWAEAARSSQDRSTDPREQRRQQDQAAMEAGAALAQRDFAAAQEMASDSPSQASQDMSQQQPESNSASASNAPSSSDEQPQQGAQQGRQGPSQQAMASGERQSQEASPQSDPQMRQLQQQMEQSSAMARELDELIAEQRRLREQTMAATSPEQAGALAPPQRELAQRIGEQGATAPFSEIANDRPDSRLRAASAISSAQEQLAAMPQVLNLTQRAARLWWHTLEVEQEAERQADQARFEDQALARRVAATAKQQALEAQSRLEGLSAPVHPQAAAALAMTLAPYSPETARAVESLGRELAPALTSLDRSIRSKDDAATDRAVAQARRAIEVVQRDLGDAQEQLMDRNPLMAARAYAEAAARSLAGPESSASSALAQQSSTEEALARAADQAIHEAAAARMAQAPGLGALMAGPTPGLGRGIAGTGTGESSGAAVVTAAPPRQSGMRDWDRLQARQQGDLSIAPSDAAPPGYHDALRAYFEALGKMQQQAEGGAR